MKGQDMEQKTHGLLSLKTLVEIMLMLVAAFSAYLLNQADTRMKDAQAGLTNAEAFFKQKEAESLDRQFSLALFDKIAAALKSGDPSEQEALRAVVTATVTTEPLRSGLIQAFSVSKNSDVKKSTAEILSAEAEFNREEPESLRSQAEISQTDNVQGEQSAELKSGPLSKYKNLRLDVFWCENSSGSEAYAQRLANQLKEDGIEAVRVRMLPSSINAKFGYRHKGYDIRCNSSEDKIAEDLSLSLAKVDSKITFDLQRSWQRTPDYLSIFVCP